MERAIAERDRSTMFHLRFVVCKGLRASAHWPKIATMVNLPSERLRAYDVSISIPPTRPANRL